MFDPDTAGLLRSAPRVPGLDPNDLPTILTWHYAELASMRLRSDEARSDYEEDGWSLERIADTYELAVSLQAEGQTRAAAAFVAGTAQQILARRLTAISAEEDLPPNIDRDQVDPSLTAAVLFLASEQYADASEAAENIQTDRASQTYEAKVISEHIADLAKGRLSRILKRAESWRQDQQTSNDDLEGKALAVLLEALSAGIEMLAARMLHVDPPEPTGQRFDSPKHAFNKVRTLSSSNKVQITDVPENLTVSYAGPYHLASLLLAVEGSINDAALLNVPAPSGSNSKFWEKWLKFRADKFPFVWRNHREAIDKQFHQTGISSVVILPTGAGKTTISSLKIAGVLARGKKVAFLAPTHALVDQLTEDLQEMFPHRLVGSVVSSDFDLLMQQDAVFQDIEVMTPERCLAMLSFAPDAFVEVGLLVFDECHLLSQETGKIRRALDAMLCVLGFNHVAQDADLLFLSAMINNGTELAQWLEELTGRAAVAVDLMWKPSRQARGVIIYDEKQLNYAKSRANRAQAAENRKKKKVAKTMRATAKRYLLATPYAIWGLEHNWLRREEENVQCSTTKLLDDLIELSGTIKYGQVDLSPNANRVAIKLAAAAANSDLKTIVFVNTKREATFAATEISRLLTHQVNVEPREQERWDALEFELGDLRHSLLSNSSSAVPHNSAMLRLERDIAERKFKQPDGARVIVATSTLAQGLNLPAQLAILAGDKRADTVGGGRIELEAHEILNAAARAGRAGHLANGLVLLIPEPIISFVDKNEVNLGTIKKLQAILPEDDHCVSVSDPIEKVLDILMQGIPDNSDVRYIVNRMATLKRMDDSDETIVLFDLQKSLGAFAARCRDEEAKFADKVIMLKQAIERQEIDGLDLNISVFSSQSGMPAKLLIDLKQRITDQTGSLPTTVTDWLNWMINWLQQDEYAKEELLGDIYRRVLVACGKKMTANLENEDLGQLGEALIAWVNGFPLSEIERILDGQPDANDFGKRTCPRARELVTTIVPRAVSFAMGLIAHMVEHVDPFEQQNNLDRQLVECLSTMVRKGFNQAEMLSFASSRKEILSRVQIHEAWKQRPDDAADDQ